MGWASARIGTTSRKGLWAGIESMGCGYKEGRGGVKNGGGGDEKRGALIPQPTKGFDQ